MTRALGIRPTRLAVAALVAAIGLAGCQSAYYAHVMFSSEPAGALVRERDTERFLAQTPEARVVERRFWPLEERKATIPLVFEKRGYKPKVVEITIENWVTTPGEATNASGLFEVKPILSDE